MFHTLRYEYQAAPGKYLFFILKPQFHFAIQIFWIIRITAEKRQYFSKVMFVRVDRDFVRTRKKPYVFHIEPALDYLVI